MNDYKQIEFSPLYYINKGGNSVLKECNPTYYIIIDGKMYHRRHIYGKPEKELDENIFCIKNNMIFRKIKIYKNPVGYSVVSVGGRNLYVHRLVYRTFVGVIPSRMEINHIDHNKENNSLENLELLTHSENLEKSAKFYGKRVRPRCKCCGRKIDYSVKSVYCKKCRESKGIVDKYQYQPKMSLRRAERPDKFLLAGMILSESFLEIGRKYGVSDNAVRKWCKYYDLPFRKRDIELRKGELETLRKNSTVSVKAKW